MKKIELSQGYYTLVDDEDFEYINQFKWNVRIVKNTQYAKRSDRLSSPKTIQMHREIMRCPENMMVDHINGNGLDNRKENLRICTRSNNLMNSKKPNMKTTSKYKGVNKIKNAKKKKWRAEIRLNRQAIQLGSFETEELAAIAYNEGALKYFGEFARLNEVK
jgi:maltodextrin utilization protein YvdJ